MDDKRITLNKSVTIKEINFLRGFGVIAVIAIHTTGYFTEVGSLNILALLNLWTDIFSQFAVPLFVLISGFVLVKNYRNNFSLKEFYKKRIRSIVPQYVFFSLGYTALNNWDAMRNSSPDTNLALILKNIWQANASYHLWFFLLIIQFYIIYPLFIKTYDLFKLKSKAETAISLMLIMQVLWLAGTHIPYLTAIKNNFFIAYLFYFGMGIYSYDHFEQLKNKFNHFNFFLLTISLALTIGAASFIVIGLKMGYRYYDIPSYFFIGPEFVYPMLRISTFLLLFGMASELIGKRSIPAKVVYKIGDYSFGIYLIHILFNQYAIKILREYNVEYSDWVFYPSVFAATLVLSYLAVRLIGLLPCSYYIIGYRNKVKTYNKT